MTVTNTQTRTAPIVSTGVETTWSYTFDVAGSEDIRVATIDTEGTVAKITSFGVDLAAKTVSFGPVPAGTTVLIYRATEPVQETDLTVQGPLLPEVLEDGLDKLTRIVQELREASGNAVEEAAAPLLMSPGENSQALPPPAARAGKVIMADAAGNIIAAEGQPGPPGPAGPTLSAVTISADAALDQDNHDNKLILVDTSAGAVTLTVADSGTWRFQFARLAGIARLRIVRLSDGAVISYAGDGVCAVDGAHVVVHGSREADSRPLAVGTLGQSNTLGANDGGPNPASPRVHTLDGGVSPMAIVVGGSDYTQLPWTRPAPDGNGGNNNIALAYAHRLAEETGRNVVIVMDAVGGKSIDEWVASGTASTRYAAFKAKADYLFGLPEMTDVDKFHCIIWDQGEEDSLTMDEATYLAKFDTLVNQLRAEAWFGDGLPLYTIGQSDLHDRYQIWQAQQDYSAYHDNAVIPVPVNGCLTEYDVNGDGTGDPTHFLGPSLWEIGYYRVAGAARLAPESAPALFFGRSTGPTQPGDRTAIARFSTLVGWDSRTGDFPVTTAFNPTGALIWGGAKAYASYSYAFGYPDVEVHSSYSTAIGRDLKIYKGGYSRLSGYQNQIGGPLDEDPSVRYGAADGRGHIIMDEGGYACGKFSKYTTAQTDAVMFQVGIGTSKSNRENAITVHASGAVELNVTHGKTPAQNGELTFVLDGSDDTKLYVHVRGNDGTVRKATLTLS